MEHKIGEIVTMPDGRKVRVKAAKSHLFQCSDCVFWMMSECLDGDFKCHKNIRSDNTTIYYVDAEEE